MPATTTTQIADHILEAENTWKWAREHLSPARLRAFEDQYEQLGRTKWSQEFRQAQAILETIENDYIASQWQRTQKIEEEAILKDEQLKAQIRELENQIAALRDKRDQVRDDRNKEMFKIHREAQQLESYKTQLAICEEKNQQDQAAFKPKRLELMQRFYDRQVAANANN